MNVIDALDGYWAPIAILMNMVLLWIGWTFKQATVSRADFVQFSRDINETIKTNDDEIKAQIRKLDKRITTTESELKHMPDHDDLKRIHSRLDGFGETLSEVKGATSASINQLELIHEHLLSRKGNY